MKVIHTHLKNVEIPELCHRESEILCGLIPEASIAEMLLSGFVFYSSPLSLCTRGRHTVYSGDTV